MCRDMSGRLPRRQKECYSGTATGLSSNQEGLISMIVEEKFTNFSGEPRDARKI